MKRQATPRPLYRDPLGVIPDETMRGFMEGFAAEVYLVQAIKSWLLTPEQAEWLYRQQLDIADLLNGRVPGDANQYKAGVIFDDWNARLGAKKFGS